MDPLNKALSGKYGVVNETGTTAITGSFDVIDCLTATTFATLTEAGNASGDALTGTAWPAGTQFRGTFLAITLTSGAIRAYKSPPLSV